MKKPLHFCLQMIRLYKKQDLNEKKYNNIIKRKSLTYLKNRLTKCDFVYILFTTCSKKELLLTNHSNCTWNTISVHTPAGMYTKYKNDEHQELRIIPKD